ncbi:hypothetical protein ACGF8D_04640 [Streptomyces massasporeus]|uniref:hypothetical protein n=1 Tax=Streptomyces massasporeus TaxID=67324 RepID=UPI0037240D19
MPGVAQRTQAAAGCLTTALGAGAGLTVWAVGARGRFRRFEAAPGWSVLYAEPPLAVLGGAAAALAAWALLRRLRPRR